MIYHDVTIAAMGERRSHRTHDTARLAPEAVEVFAGMLARHGPAFFEPIPIPAFAHLSLRWTAALPGVALATFGRGDHPYTTSVLLAGTNPADEPAALRTVQGLVNDLLRQLAPAGTEPGYDLAGVRERPVIASVVLPSAVPGDDLQLIADMETCLAAAYITREMRG